MKAFAYLRVSGKDQVDGDGFPRQLAEIKAYAKAHGIRIVRVFEERGVCGETEWENRPAWSELVASLNGVKMILVESLNRLARELFIQEYVLRDLKKRGVTLISVREQDIDSSPERILFRQIMGAIAQYDKTMIVMKLRGARQRMKAKMGRCEGAKPYGSLPGEDAVLGEMRRMAADGHSMAAIARELNSRGVMPRRGKAWHPYAVSRMLVAKK
jgi:DNA invertase Pin-like site-specific DNA recombinase